MNHFLPVLIVREMLVAIYNMKDMTKLECILLTDETKVVIPKNMSEWEINVFL